MQVTLEYYAQLREQAGRSREAVETTAQTVDQLYAERRALHGFSLDPSLLKVAVNSQFSEWSRPLAEGDTVVFIPPVAGG